MLPKILIQLNYCNCTSITALDYKLPLCANQKGRIFLKNALESKDMVFKKWVEKYNCDF